MGRRLLLLGLFAVFVGTGCEGETLVVEPSSGSMSGYYPVELQLPADQLAAADVVSVQFGPISTYALEVLAEDRIAVTVQGHPSPGAVPVVVATAGEVFTFEDAFEYQPALDPHFDRVVSLGASFTQGVQDGVPTDHAILNSSAAVLARQMGAYFPLPQMVPDLFPPMDIDDIGPSPECEVPSAVSYLAFTLVDTLGQMKDPETGLFAFHTARVDPDLAVQNLGVGGFRMQEIVHAPEDDDFTRQFLAHMVYEPYGDLYGAVEASPLELAEQIEPTIVVAVDLFGNDLVVPILEGSVPEPDAVAPVEQFEADFIEMCDRLTAVGSEVFVANVPQPSLLPAAEERRRWVVAQGYMTVEEFDEAVDEIDAKAVAFNDVVAQQAASRPAVHVVDFAGAVETMKNVGVPAGGDTLYVERFGGLVSLDGLHFTDVGYAYLANLFIETINADLGTSIPPADLDAIYLTDVSTPEALRGRGLDPDECEL